MGLLLRTLITLFEGLALDFIIVAATAVVVVAATVAVIPTVLTHSFSDFELR